MKETLCSTTQTATPPAAIIAHDLLDGLVGLAFDAGHRLVEQQALGVVHQRARHADQLLLAEGEVATIRSLRDLRQTDPLENGVRAVARCRARSSATRPRPQHDIEQHRSPG